MKIIMMTSPSLSVGLRSEYYQSFNHSSHQEWPILKTMREDFKWKPRGTFVSATFSIWTSCIWRRVWCHTTLVCWSWRGRYLGVNFHWSDQSVYLRVPITTFPTMMGSWLAGGPRRQIQLLLGTHSASLSDMIQDVPHPTFSNISPD